MQDNYKEINLANTITLYKSEISLSTKFTEPVVSVIKDEVNYIYINFDYAKNNMVEVKTKLISFIQNYRKNSISILSTSLIDNDILKAIASNPKITSVTLGSKYDPYLLNRERFDILDSSDSIYYIDTEAVIGTYNSREMDILSFFSNRKLVDDTYTYQMLNDDRIINLIRPLSEIDINNLAKYSKKGIRIFFEYNDVENIIRIIEALRGRGNEFRIMNISIIKEHAILFEKYKNENITLDRCISFNRFLEVEKILDLGVKDIRESNLSPYEKYLAVFKIVKDFKTYQDEGNGYKFNTSESTDLYKILFNDYIVCRGFSELMIDLLQRVGIPATFFCVEILKDSEELSIEDFATLTPEEQRIKAGTKDYHSRIIFRLIDPKYDIDGIFIGDVTWDQDEELELYNHSALTPYETRFEYDTLYNTNDDIFDIQSGTEFYAKLKKFPNSINRFLEIIEEIDLPFYKYLKGKYDLEGSYTTNFFIEVYSYIILHTNKRITKETLFKGLREVIDFTYVNTPENIKEEIIEKIIKDFEKGEEYYFTNDFKR